MEEPRSEGAAAETLAPEREPKEDFGDSTPLFVYGTLMNDQVLLALLGRVPPTQGARLSGYHRYRIKDYVFPAIRPKEGGTVRGHFMPGLSPREKYIFDLFEDEDYHKVDVEVQVDGLEAPQTATCYVWNASLESMLYSTWEPTKHFAEDGPVPDYVCMVKGFAQEIEAERFLESVETAA